MSAAPAYNRTKNFLDNNPDHTDHGAINSELDAASLSINSLRTNAALIQDDDGTLAEKIVGMAQLDDDLQNKLGGNTTSGAVENPAGAWEDSRGLSTERSYFDGRPKGFSFLAMDTGLLYFKLSQTIADWSNGYSFGKGDPGNPGDPGTPGTVDYSLTVRTNVTADQSMNGSLSGPSFIASQNMGAPKFTFQGNALRLIPANGRLRLDDGSNQSSPVSLELASLITAGTGVSDTGVKLLSGADIGTLFDPAGAAAGKLAGVEVGSATATLSGKTSITVTLSVVNNQLHIGVTTA